MRLASTSASRVNDSPRRRNCCRTCLVITRTCEDTEHLLEHVTRLQSEAFAVASTYGISQTALADVSLLSRQRVGQLANATEVSRVDIAALIDQIQQVDDHPQGVMGAVSTEAMLAADIDARDALVDRQIEVVYGREKSTRRQRFEKALARTLIPRPRLSRQTPPPPRLRHRKRGDRRTRTPTRH